MYKVKLTRQPEYLSEYIRPLVRSCNLRSSGTDLQHISDCNLSPTNILRHDFSFVLLQSGTVYRSTLDHSLQRQLWQLLLNILNLTFLVWHTPYDHVTISVHPIRLVEIDTWRVINLCTYLTIQPLNRESF